MFLVEIPRALDPAALDMQPDHPSVDAEEDPVRSAGTLGDTHQSMKCKQRVPVREQALQTLLQHEEDAVLSPNRAVHANDLGVAVDLVMLAAEERGIGCAPL